jgi:hypothetical protein
VLAANRAGAYSATSGWSIGTIPPSPRPVRNLAPTINPSDVDNPAIPVNSENISIVAVNTARRPHRDKKHQRPVQRHLIDRPPEIGRQSMQTDFVKRRRMVWDIGRREREDAARRITYFQHSAAHAGIV